MSKTKKRAMIESDSDDSGSSDIEQELKAQAKRAKPSPTTAHSSSSGSSSGSDDEWTMEGKKKGEKEKKKVTKGVRGQVGKRMPAGRKAVAHRSSSGSSHDEDGEEGEGESQGVGSSESSESSSSDSDSSSDDESLQFDDGLDEHLVGNEEDRSILSNMTDVEREQEMYQRYEKRQMQKARFEIEQKLRRERHAKKKKAREMAERELNRAVRTSRRSRLEDSSKSKAMDELKAKRSADKQRQQQQQQQAAGAESTVAVKEPLNAAEIYSSNSEQESSSSSESESEGGDSEDEAGDRSLTGLHDSAPRYISTVEEINKIKLSRFRLEKWVHMPFFKDVVVGCYVRVGIGAHEGRMVYRVCEITDIIETPKIYSLGPTKTNKCLRLRHGQQERSFRMEYVSNSPFADSEFSKWKNELEQRGYPLPTVDFIRKKSKRIEQAKSFQFKEEDIEKILEEKRKFRKTPTNYAMTKSRLLRQKELAEEDGDSEKVVLLTQQLSELEEKAEQLDKQRSKGLSAISYINERNRQRNVTRAEQALKEEMADSRNKKDDDPFTRRRCKPTLVTLTKEAAAVEGASAGQLLQQYSKAQTEEDKEAIKATLRETVPQILSPTTPNGQKAAGSLSAALQAQSTPSASLLSATPIPPPPTPASNSQTSSSDDLFSAHDFDIHIDLPSTPEGTTTVQTLHKTAAVVTPRTDDGPKRSLNLADYKKRRGLI